VIFFTKKKGPFSKDLKDGTRVTVAFSNVDTANAIFTKIFEPETYKGIRHLPENEENRNAVGMFFDKSAGHYKMVVLEYNISTGECCIAEIKEAAVMKHHAKRKFEVELVNKKVLD